MRKNLKERKEDQKFTNFTNLFKSKEKYIYDHNAIAEILRVSPEALNQFEKAYINAEKMKEIPENFFDLSIKDVQQAIKSTDVKYNNKLINRIVNELLDLTPIFSYEKKSIRYKDAKGLPDEKKVVTLQELQNLNPIVRPQLTGTLMKIDLSGPESCQSILYCYDQYLQQSDKKKKDFFYHHFRQGLDILDLDPVTYEILGCNVNSMGYWLPKIAKAIDTEGFFYIPATKIIKVPITLLQMSRVFSYDSILPITFMILDQYISKVFQLDPMKSYFVKTGTYSSKYDFRNAHVTSPKEVNELGEYLLFLSHQAVMMASPLSKPSIYGVSTTNEWVVREYIEDKENNPCIYHGMPLHTEYRIFVDFDTKEILAIHPYWDPEVMKNRFSKNKDSGELKMIHDDIVFRMHEPILMQRYSQNKEQVLKHIENVIKNTDSLHGQWSIDIMQNGDDFWFIDMALAQYSAYKEYIPKEKRITYNENWIPKIG